MRASVYGSLVFLLLAGCLTTGPGATAGEEKSEGVVTGTVAFEAGETVPDMEHRFIKIRSLAIDIGEPSGKKLKQKIAMKMRVDNFGEKDHKVIITTYLLDADDKIVAAKTVKDDIDDNDSEKFRVKLALPQTEVARVENVRLEVSYLKD
jgi:hypothetical protein